MKRLLVALDSSPRAPLVLAAARRLAEMSGAKLVLYRAITVPPDLPREVIDCEKRLDEVLLATARSELQRFAAELPSEVVESVGAEFATAWDGICRAAKALNVDMIVIGSHGFGGLDHLIGTTAAKVVNHADRNVLVVRTNL